MYRGRPGLRTALALIAGEHTASRYVVTVTTYRLAAISGEQGPLETPSGGGSLEA
ncbi:hypothetical protein AAII07_04890 [Microvirga sp. 0TCS3.31]